MGVVGSRLGNMSSGTNVGAAAFDFATSDYLYKTDGLAGESDTKKFTVSFWIHSSAEGPGSGSIPAFHCRNPSVNSQLVVQAGLNSLGRMNASASLDVSTPILSIQATNPEWTANTWNHVFMSFDMASASNRYLLLNGVDITGAATVSEYNDIAFPFASATLETYIGRDNVGGTYNSLDGSIAELWMDCDTFLTPSSIDKFLRGRYPVSLGADGSTPTGNQPTLYFKGNGNDFAVNLGTGGTFLQNGSLSTSTLKPVRLS